MKVGIGVIPQNYPDWTRYEAQAFELPSVVPDASVIEDAISLVQRAESLGLESVWAVEHHFTPYALVPNPIQLMTYFAAATRTMDVGTMITVLPWHHPLRLAAELSVLDILLQDRQIHLGMGRGSARTEFQGFGIDPSQTRGIFAESLEILRRALSQERFSFEGEHYTIPEITTRPRPRSAAIVDNMLMAWGSPDSLPIAAEAGLKPIFIPQRSWTEYADEVDRFNAIRAARGWAPARPTAAVWIYCAPTAAEAEEEGSHFMAEYADSARRHYKLDDPTAFGKGYEHYQNRARIMASEGPRSRDKTAEMLRKMAVIGTPEECLRQLSDIARGLALEHVVGVFQYGTMPRSLAERSLALFADHIAPRLKQIDVQPRVATAAS